MLKCYMYAILQSVFATRNGGNHVCHVTSPSDAWTLMRPSSAYLGLQVAVTPLVSAGTLAVEEV